MVVILAKTVLEMCSGLGTLVVSRAANSATDSKAKFYCSTRLSIDIKNIEGFSLSSSLSMGGIYRQPPTGFYCPVLLLPTLIG